MRTVEDSGDLPKESANPFGTLWNLNVQQLLDGKGVAQFICHWVSLVNGEIEVGEV